MFYDFLKDKFGVIFFNKTSNAKNYRNSHSAKLIDLFPTEFRYMCPNLIKISTFSIEISIHFPFKSRELRNYFDNRALIIANNGLRSFKIMNLQINMNV